MQDNIILVGTGHILEKSVKEVDVVIDREEPDVVAVELCEGRYEALKGNVGDFSIKEVISGGSPFLILTHWLLAYVQRKMGAELGIEPGADMMAAIKKGEEVKLPQIIATAERAVERAKFSNPYAKAKAIAAYSMAEKVAELDVKGCFMMKNPEEYVPVVAAAHELLREAAKLAFEAREIEKQADSLVREPHSRTGEILKKKKLMEKPSA